MSSLSTVVRMLSQARYRYQDRSKRQVNGVINNYRALEPKLDLYTFPNGSSAELLALVGTIPVHYLGATYNIPIAIYLPKDFPEVAPICYVKPTPDMMIKQSKHVDGCGQIYLPYLSDWKANSSDLLGVIQVMIIIFGESPPVYQRPKQPYASNSKPADTCPYPRQPPPPPTYNCVAGFPTPPSSSGYPPVSTGYPPYPASTAAGYPAATSVATSMPGYPPVSGYPGYPPVPPTANSLASPVTSTPTQGFGTQTVTHEHIKASLISAIEEEVRKKIVDKVSGKEAEIEVLKNTAKELDNGKMKLESMLAKFETESVEISESKRALEEKNNQFQDLINKLENSAESPADIEEAFGPVEPLFKQLLNTYAEENAVTDAIYYLSEGLQKGVLDLDLFLKHIRDLSRRQFMLRALMQKCRERAGLPY